MRSIRLTPWPIPTSPARPASVVWPRSWPRSVSPSTVPASRMLGRDGADRARLRAAARGARASGAELRLHHRPHHRPVDVGAGHPARRSPAATSARRRSSGGRRFADGLSSWLVRRLDGPDELAVFDRPAGSERDLVVLAEAMGATLVQRHPAGSVRAVGAFGVLRWDGLRVAPRAADHDSGSTRSACAAPRRPGGARDHPRVRGARPRLTGHRRHPRLPARSTRPTSPIDRPTSFDLRAPPARPAAAADLPAGRPGARCATCSPRSTAPPCSTAPARCASSACAWCRAPRPRPTSRATAACATPPAAATASTTPRPPSSWSARTARSPCCARASSSAPRPSPPTPSAPAE